MIPSNFMLLATAWGARHGGINAFNRDFAVGLATALGTDGTVFCAVPDPRPDDEADARNNGVRLVPLLGKGRVERFDPDWVYRISAWMRDHAENAPIAWWVGHDVVSGDAALEGPKAVHGSGTALIHHMSYLAYQAYKHDNAVEAVDKARQQRRLFSTPTARLFAVGPVLRDSCEELRDSEQPVTMLVPGFAGEPITKRGKPRGNLSAVSFGRMETASDRIKQGRLALAGFGAAAKYGKEPGGPANLEKPTFYLIGLPTEDSGEAKQVCDIIEENAGRVINVLPLPYDEDRARLFDTLARTDLSLMLSWHEGFGLTGWEAIAAGVPVIVGKDSGLFKLVKETLGGTGTGCLAGLDLEGRRGDGDTPNYTEKDMISVRNAILEIAKKPEEARENALSLRRQLAEKLVCTWENTGQQFLAGLADSRTDGVSVSVGGGSSGGSCAGGVGSGHKDHPQHEAGEHGSPNSPGSDKAAAPSEGDAENASGLSGGLGSKRREQSRGQWLPVLEREICKALTASGRVVEMLERALDVPKTSGASADSSQDRVQRVCHTLLNVRFETATDVLHTLYGDLTRAEGIDAMALKAVGDVSGWLFPWLYMVHSGFECDRFDYLHLGEIIEIPSNIESFAEIVMAGTDIHRAQFEPTGTALDWPKPAFSLQLGIVEEGRDSSVHGVSVDEVNIRTALALKVNVAPAIRMSGDPRLIDTSINEEIDFRVGIGRRWYIICTVFQEPDDQKRHLELMSRVAARYPGLAVVRLNMTMASLHTKMRQIQRLMGLMPEMQS